MACVRKRRGKWVVDYRDSAGTRRWITCETRREAEELLTEKRRESRQGTRPTVDPEITVEQYALRWLRTTRATVKPATAAIYDNALRRHLLPIFGSVKIRHLRKGRIRDFLAQQLNAGFARNSVRLMLATLRGMLNSAVDYDLILANPADRLGRQLRLETTAARLGGDIKAMTRKQLALFLATAERVEPRLFPLFFTLARAGMRIGEGLALQWDDLNFSGQEIRVARGFSKKRIETPKGGVGRTVDMSRQAERLLRRLQLERTQEKLRRGWRELPAWVFVTSTGESYDLAFVQRIFKRVLKAAGLPLHFTPHCLRHTYASLMLQSGANPIYVQRQLGHASIKMTVDTYGRWLPVGDKGLVDRLDDESGSKVVAATGGGGQNAVSSQAVAKTVGAMSW